jgi:amino acid transporter
MSAQRQAIDARSGESLRRGTLGTLGISFFVVSAAAPLTAMAGGAPVAMLLGNGAGTPGAYLLTTITLLVFAVGYTTMARHHTSTGAFYSYVARGLKQPAGGAAAFVALLGYNAMQIGLYGLFGAAASGYVADELGVEIPWWFFVLVAILVVAVLGYRQVDLSVRVLSVLVVCEFVIVLVLSGVILVEGGSFGEASLSAAPLSWSQLTSGSLPVALLFAFASFIGFEATAIYSEEAKDPKRTVPRATYLAVSVIGVTYTVVSLLLVNAAGVDGLQDFIGSLGDPTTFLFAVSDSYIATSYTSIMRLLFITSVFAALLAFHNAVARYVFALGREGLLPAAAGRSHGQHQSPHVGSLTQSVLALVVVVLFIVTDQDPVLALFTWLTNLGTLAVIVLMAASSVAVIAFFRRNPELERSVIRTLIAPAVAAVALLAVVYYATSKFDLLIGNEGVLAWLLPALLPVSALVGIAAALQLRGRSPALYAQMGRHRGDDGEGRRSP